MPLNGTRHTAGFTLVEIMVAGAIFLVFCTGFLGVSTMNARTHYTAANYYQAKCLAQNRIQRARSFEYGSIAVLSENNLAVDAAGNLTSVGLYRRTTLVDTNFAGAAATRITVQIHYPAPAQLSAAPVEASTLIAVKM